MIKRTADNLNTIYVLLFLNVAFFFLQLQDFERYQAAFQLDRDRVFAGQLWRLFTYQFVQGGALSLFFSLLILYIMGSAIEEQWGSFDFVLCFLASTLATAGVALAFGIPLLGSFFLSYSLLFVYAWSNPEHTFYIFFVLPVKVKWLAWIAFAFLVLMAVLRQGWAIAALGGAAVSVAFAWRKGKLTRYKPVAGRPALPTPPDGVSDRTADRNLALFGSIKKALAEGTPEEKEALIRSIEPSVVKGVNICPPADYKPENEDRYCIRCEGFAECSIRFIRLGGRSAAVNR